MAGAKAFEMVALMVVGRVEKLDSALVDKRA